jgi:hypothetical protein
MIHDEASWLIMIHHDSRSASARHRVHECSWVLMKQSCTLSHHLGDQLSCSTIICLCLRNYHRKYSMYWIDAIYKRTKWLLWTHVSRRLQIPAISGWIPSRTTPRLIYANYSKPILHLCGPVNILTVSILLLGRVWHWVGHYWELVRLPNKRRKIFRRLCARLMIPSWFRHEYSWILMNTRRLVNYMAFLSRTAAHIILQLCWAERLREHSVFELWMPIKCLPFQQLHDSVDCVRSSMWGDDLSAELTLTKHGH